MGNISSINIKKTNAIQTKHNARDEDFKPSYLLESGGKAFECNRSSLEAELLRDRMIKEAQERYKQRTGQKFQAKSYLASAVINLKADSTMQDAERVAQHLQKKHKFQCYQIAIHRDEGHIDENGKECINYHAHLEFVTLDKETGRNMWQTKHIGIGKLRELQDEVAQILQMERGIDKRLSGVKRVEPRKYAVMKEREKAQNRERNQKIEKTLDSAHENIKAQNAIIATLKGKNTKLERENILLEQRADATARAHDRLKQENATLKEKNAEFELTRKAWIDEQNKTKEDYRALSALKQDLAKRNLTIGQVREFIENLENELRKEREARKKAENDRARLAAELESKNAQKIDAPVKEQNSFKVSADKDFKEILAESNISVDYDFNDENNAVYTHSSLYLPKAKEIRDKLENKGYYVQISANNLIEHQENRIALAFAKSKVAFDKICEFISSSWKSIYKTSEIKLIELQERLQQNTAKTDTLDDFDAKVRLFEERQKKIDSAPSAKELYQADRDEKVEQMKEKVKQSAKKLHTRTKSNDYGFER